MNNLQKSTLTDMAGRLNAFREGSFGVDRRDSTAPWVLCANRQLLPIEDFRLSLWDQDGVPICDFQALPDSHILIFDEAGKAPAKCRLALLQKKDQTVLALPNDDTPLSGFLYISAHGAGPQNLVVSALFDGAQGHQLSGLLWHTDSEVTHFLHLQANLLGGRCISNAGQLRSDLFSDEGYTPFA